MRISHESAGSLTSRYFIFIFLFPSELKMADLCANPLDEKTRECVEKAKLLMVGTGGVGCELLKDLVLTGFQDIHVIDLDTIDVSNLNRQFLFHKQHVGKPKAVIAKESALKLNPNANIVAHHDSIMKDEFGIEFFKQFDVVLNALDNIAARKHVNRMCLASDKPLIESGSTGYLGHVAVYKKKLSECFECVPRPAPKDFPTCTIRNTPSEPIHCIVWSKHLFNQLFGEEDPNTEVSPDPKDELPANENSEGGSGSNSTNSHKEKISTREWAKKCQYNAESLFKKLFSEDVEELLRMKHLWEVRRPPTPLKWDNLPDAVATSSRHVVSDLKDEEIWSIKECAVVFKNSLASLQKKLTDSNDQLVWDKDDDDCMDFVTACANIRSHIFQIPQQSRFKVKSMAGNIIPAIATTNAIVGGLIVLQLLKILTGPINKCQAVILNKNISYSRNKLITPALITPPNNDCFVCSPNEQEVSVKVNLSTLTVRTLQEKIIIGTLNMVKPGVIFLEKGMMLITGDEEDLEEMGDKVLESFGIQSGTRLKCDDEFQSFKFSLVLINDKNLSDQEFEVVSALTEPKPQEELKQESKNDKENNEASTSSSNQVVEEEEEIEAIESLNFSYKRKLPEDENGVEEVPKKRAKTDCIDISQEADDSDSEVI